MLGNLKHSAILSSFSPTLLTSMICGSFYMFPTLFLWPMSVQMGCQLLTLSKPWLLLAENTRAVKLLKVKFKCSLFINFIAQKSRHIYFQLALFNIASQIKETLGILFWIISHIPVWLTSIQMHGRTLQGFTMAHSPYCCVDCSCYSSPPQLFFPCLPWKYCKFP